jgi:hypothetical protein
MERTMVCLVRVRTRVRTCTYVHVYVHVPWYNGTLSMDHTIWYHWLVPLVW